jgi:hypothetical protein
MDTSSNTASSSGLFSRSFFGSRSTKSVRASLSYPRAHAVIQHAPPAPNLPPATTAAPAPAPDVTPLVPSQYEPPVKVPTTPQHRRKTSRHSIASSVTDIGSSLRRSRSNSLRTSTSAGTASSSSHRRTPSATLALTYSPDAAAHAAPTAARPSLSVSTFARNKARSSENVKGEGGTTVVYEKSPLSAVDKPKIPFGMAVPMPLRHPPTQKEIQQASRQANATLAPAAPIPLPNGANPNIIFQQIHELASKRISTLDYLRKAYASPSLRHVISC